MEPLVELVLLCKDVDAALMQDVVFVIGSVNMYIINGDIFGRIY